jgi:curved DNA-binding protein CbpA
LGIKPGASSDEIEAAYRQKARFAHPDAGGSTEAMQRLNDARRKLKERAA